MRETRIYWFALLLLALWGWSCAGVQAVPPWDRLLGGNRVEADPAKEYTLKEDNGPWMIMTCSFTGEKAEKQAHDLALELRKRYKLEAYTYKGGFKLDDPNGPNARGPAAIRWQYKRFHDNPKLYNDGAIKEVAVLVGNYPSVEDPEAKRTLQKIKCSQPEQLKIQDGEAVSRPLATLRMIQEKVPLPENIEHKKHGPLGHAFITTNPLLHADYYVPKGGIDELVLRMNKGVTHSLLDCQGRYTVQVARFSGSVIIDQRKIQEIENGKPVESQLAKAAEKAHELTEALRIKGYEAYEFHDRYASIVTVGSFNSVGTPRTDGKTEINPAIYTIIKTFGAAPIT
ncbi:MAG: hypothetical protein ABSG68_15400, partial [Thermoguttaceae bacterium]